MTETEKKRTFREQLQLYLKSAVELDSGQFELDDGYVKPIIKTCGIHFELDHVLPMGSEAFLFLVRDTYLQTLRVLKIPRPDLPKEAMERFIRSVRTLTKLNSPYFPRVLYLSANPFFVLLDWAPGLTLRDWCFFNRYGHDEIFHFFRELLIALALLHDEGISHRDIRPDNILVTPEESVKVIDFGLSKKKSDSRLTIIKALGNVYYSAPEQLRDAGKYYDATLDVYSAGMTLYFLICRNEARHGEHNAQIFSTFGLSKLLPFWEKCVEANPENRYKNGREALAAFDRIVPPPIALTEEEESNKIAFLVEALSFLFSGDIFLCELFVSPFLTESELKELRIMIKNHKIEKIISM